MRTCQSAGTYLRVIDPDWPDPLDGAVAISRGGRWNPPGTFPAIYLSADLDTSRANARLMIDRAITGMPFGFEDLDPAGLPALLPVHVPSADILDAMTADGLQAAGLPVTYPRQPAGDPLPWLPCQRAGTRAHRDGIRRIAYRSAAFAAGGGELAWIGDASGLRAGDGTSRTFADWFWADPDGTAPDGEAG
ncbi:MAG: RES domain-containing protein [Actinomycetales bacterium]|nr:RES domain-containing protein [Actinomycetales bacterium]